MEPARSPAVAPPISARRGAVKICGVTRIEDARRSVELGADLVGLNFHPPSPRCLTAGDARALRREIGDRALAVGVFVHQTVEQALAIAERVGLDLLQFHGEQQPGDLRQIAERAILVLRPGDEHRARAIAESGPWAVLFDAPLAAGADGEMLHGGTGTAWDYDRVARLDGDGLRVLVAGGVGPENAGRALSVDGVWGIDVCSAIESAPGVKDPARMEALFASVADHRAAVAS